MPERVAPGPVEGPEGIREAVCIHTKKIYDSCRDKDCIEDLRFYPTVSGQAVLNNALTVKGGTAELLYVYIDVEPVNFNRGCYTIDMRFFYHVTVQAFGHNPRPTEVEGLCVFDKRVILFGSEGNVKSYSSEMREEDPDPQQLMGNNLPNAVVEAVDPIVLEAKFREACDCCCCCCTDIPCGVTKCFSEELDTSQGNRQVLVTLGQFSIVRLERDSQLLIPVYNYCLPEKECAGGEDGDPCDLFQNIAFPVNEFFPPNTLEAPCSYNGVRKCCCSH